MITFAKFAAAAVVGFSLALSGALAHGDKAAPQSRAQVQLSYAPLVRSTAPAVVNIYTRRVVQEVVRSRLFSDPFFKRFFGDELGLKFSKRRKRLQNSLGSGVILDPVGLVVTNFHVIKGADEITVALSDRREFAAKVVLNDEDTDLAVLKIDAGGKGLPFIELRNSDELEVGDLVLAIGNPFNVGQTVTSGIISALARTGVGVSDFQFFIQTDAAINPGNSGGALVGMDGKLAGINTAIYSSSGGSLGIGFAIPSNMVRLVLQSARNGHDRVRRPWLGVDLQPVTAEIAASLGFERPSGVLVRAIYPKSPAERAGLRVGDVIAAIDGLNIDSKRALNFRLGTRMIGGRAVASIIRRGKQRTIGVDLEVAPETPAREETLLRGKQPLAGAVVVNLSPAVAEEMHLDPFQDGVVVRRVAPRSPAKSYLDLKAGDIVLKVNGLPVTSVREIVREVAKPTTRWELRLRRGQRTVDLVVGG